MDNILLREFYKRNPETVAKDLLGKVLVRKFNNQIISGIIVETEAYLAMDDHAAHAFRGKTKSNNHFF